MHITSILRSGAVALTLIAAVTAIGPAFAAPADKVAQSQQNQNSNTGPYDGPAWEAAKQVQTTQDY